jgi:hypothetical protein
LIELLQFITEKTLLCIDRNTDRENGSTSTNSNRSSNDNISYNDEKINIQDVDSNLSLMTQRDNITASILTGLSITSLLQDKVPLVCLWSAFSKVLAWRLPLITPFTLQRLFMNDNTSTNTSTSTSPNLHSMEGGGLGVLSSYLTTNTHTHTHTERERESYTPLFTNMKVSIIQLLTSLSVHHQRLLTAMCVAIDTYTYYNIHAMNDLYTVLSMALFPSIYLTYKQENEKITKEKKDREKDSDSTSTSTSTSNTISKPIHPLLTTKILYIMIQDAIEYVCPLEQDNFISKSSLMIRYLSTSR